MCNPNLFPFHSILSHLLDILFVLYMNVCSILLDYDFNKLEDIWFTSASHFTMATIELLMDRLPEVIRIGKWLNVQKNFMKLICQLKF